MMKMSKQTVIWRSVAVICLALPLIAAAPVAAQTDNAEIEFWRSVDSSVQGELEAYLEAYPQGKFAPLARARLKALAAAKSDAAKSDDGQKLSQKQSSLEFLPLTIPKDTDGSSRYHWLRPHTTKTTLIKLDNDLYAELYCRIEPGRIAILINSSVKAGIYAAVPFVGSIAPTLIDEATKLVVRKGDVFCVAFKTENRKHPRANNLTEGLDLKVTLKAYAGDKIQEKSDICKGRICFVGMRVNATKDTDALTTCFELEKASDGKPRSFVVGAGAGNYEKRLDVDQQEGQWPVAVAGCAQRTF